MARDIRVFAGASRTPSPTSVVICGCVKLQGRTLGAPASNPPKRYYNL